jgi:dynein heavy chain
MYKTLLCTFQNFLSCFNGCRSPQYLLFFLQVDKVKAEEKLEAARPALEEAEAALQTIKPAHIATGTQLKTLKLFSTLRFNERWRFICAFITYLVLIFNVVNISVRKLAKPPHLIMRIMDAVLLLFQRHVDPVTLDPDRPSPKPSWHEALKLMSATNMLQGLLTFPKASHFDYTNEVLQSIVNKHI